MPRTLASYLADLDGDALRRMLSDNDEARARLSEDLKGVEYERTLIVQALGRKSRRVSSSGTAAGSGSGASPGGGKVTRSQILALVAQRWPNSKFSSRDLMTALAQEGIQIEDSAVRQHLRRAWRADKLARVGELYVLPHKEPQASDEPETIFNGHESAVSASPNGVHPAGEGQEQGGGVGSRFGSE
jgi:hypothetical protein